MKCFLKVYCAERGDEAVCYEWRLELTVAVVAATAVVPVVGGFETEWGVVMVARSCND